jgi:hypothetical protein
MDGYYAQQSAYEAANISYQVLAAYNWTTPEEIIAGEAGKTIYVQAIIVNTITDNAAVQTWQDDATTPVPIAKTPASPGFAPRVYDFGPIGRPLTQGKSLDHVMSAAGLAADVTILAYKRVTATSPS